MLETGGDTDVGGRSGPGAVTYGQNIAYTATFSNDGSSTFTHATYKMAPPVIQATGETATFVKASCGSIDSAGVLTCDFGQLRSGELDRLTVVWNVPAGDSKVGCTDCLIANSTWLINENKTTNGNETFTQGETADLIGSSATEPVERSASGRRLRDHGLHDGWLKPQHQPGGLEEQPRGDLVLSARLLDDHDRSRARDHDHGDERANPHASEVCVAALGQNCPAGTRADFGSSGEVITFTFRISADALPKNYKITKVFHNGHEVDVDDVRRSTTGASSRSRFDKKTKIWTVITTAETNGPWSW